VNTRLLVAGCAVFMSVALVSARPALRGPESAVATGAAIPVAQVVQTGARSAGAHNATAQRALIDQYCVGCHNARTKTANLMLDQLDLTTLGAHAEIGEKIVRKLRAGLMPPTNARRPDTATLETMIRWMEDELDKGAATHLPHLPPPGLHRLNRTEYTNAIRDVLGLEVDATKFLPPDDSTSGFDNIAGALTMSPALMQAYLSAAGKISRLAMGNVSGSTQTVYDAAPDTSQNSHIEGLPFDTRGGMLIRHEFPADGEYVFQVRGMAAYSGGLLGGIKGEQLEILVDGELVKLYDWDREITGRNRGGQSPRIPIKAGLHTVGVTFLSTTHVPNSDINLPFERTMNAPGSITGFHFYPHVGQVSIEGPFNFTDAADGTDTPSRRKIFVCRPPSPSSPSEETACARTIISTLVKRAFRRPAAPADMEFLTPFYLSGRRDGGSFDDGIESVVQRVLADAEFIYRAETEPAGLAPGESYRVDDLDLASRLSFFLWSSVPDEELLDLAAQGRLRNPAVLEQQVRRMLADPRIDALIRNFTGQWLSGRALKTSEPAVNLFPDFDDRLREAFQRELEMFFGSIVKEDRSVLELLSADYTFVNERLAKHYGIPNIYGTQFRRVTLGTNLDMRRGLLGKGALLTLTSIPARTSPVARGKWIQQTLLGVAPPDPPPGVEGIKPKPADNTGNLKVPSMREQMVLHRTNPTCASCHNIFEPVGIALENFDAVGAWRTEDEGVPIDATGVLADGTRLDGVASLRNALTQYSGQFARVLTEKLLTYALGRGVEYPDMPLVRSIVRGAAPKNYAFSNLVLGIVESPAFQMNMKNAATGERRAAR
jgi:mono/diheme cytochrome c family protein